MEEVEIERRLTETEARSKSNMHRLDKLEDNYEVLNKLVTSVEVMGTNIQHMDKSLKALDAKVAAQEAKPGKRWDSLVSTVLGIVVGAILAFVLSHIGL